MGEDLWPCKGGNLNRTGFSPYSVPKSLGEPSWSFLADDDELFRSVALIDSDKNLYFTSTYGGDIRKFSSSGDVLWAVKPCLAIPGAAAMAQGLLFASCARGDVFALRQEDGTEAWRIKADNVNSDTWSMTAAHGVLVFPDSPPFIESPGGGNLRLNGVNASTGAALWKFESPFLLYNPMPSVVGDTLIFSDIRGNVYRLGLVDGKMLWTAPAPERAGWSTGAMAVSPDGQIFVASNVLPEDFPKPVSVIDMMIYAALLTGGPNISLTLTAMQTGMLSSYALEDGSLLWRRPVGHQANAGPAVGVITSHPGTAVVLGVGSNPLPVLPLPDFPRNDIHVLAFDAATGNPIWDLALPPWRGSCAGESTLPAKTCLPDSWSTPAISGDGVVYIGGLTGRAYAILDADGDGNISSDPAAGELSSFDATFGFQGAPAIVDGMLAMASCGGLYVWKN